MAYILLKYRPTFVLFMVHCLLKLSPTLELFDSAELDCTYSIHYSPRATKSVNVSSSKIAKFTMFLRYNFF